MTTRHRLFVGALAIGVSCVCVVMAAAAAGDRASTDADRWIMTAVAVALALGSHLLPALARRSLLANVLFVGCICTTMYHHAHYFAGAQHRAGQERAEAVATTAKAQALADELDANAATRPLPAVTKDLAQATAKAAQAALSLSRCKADGDKCGASEAAVAAAEARVQALADERAVALRVAELRRLVADEAAAHDGKRADQAADPVDAQLAALTGLSEKGVALVLALAQSLMLELLAVVLWMLALPEPAPVAQTAAAAEKSASFFEGKPETAPVNRPTEHRSLVTPTATPAPSRWWARWRHLWPWPVAATPSIDLTLFQPHRSM